MIGQTIGHYTISAKLGAGGMGEVYLAEDAKLGRSVALKFLPDALWNQTEAQQRLVREAKAASKLDHPNIVTIHGIEEFEGRPFIIMARVRGVPLNEYCTVSQRTIDDLIDLSLQMASGLQHAHEAGVIHRDLKPSNILVDETGRVRVLDFGIASLRGAAKLTQTGSTIGTLAYSPPELARGMEAEPTADVYSLGVVIYQMLTGHLPFEADHEAALLYSILNEPATPMSDHTSEIPENIEAVVMKCLDKDPSKRFANCSELLKQLEQSKAKSENGSSGLSDKPSIAVIPFVNMSNDPENEYFSDGLTEELLNVLAKNPGLKVTGRTSSFMFKGKHEDLRDIGQKLGVETILEGSVRKAGNRVRITTQLVKTSDGFHLWSETYDRVIEDVFAVQDEIASAVSDAMHVTLLGAPKKNEKAAINPKVLTLVFQAGQFVSRLTETDVAKAVQLYNEAIAIDPNEARAWAGLAMALGTQMGYGYVTLEDAFDATSAATEKALELDDTLPDAHWAMGWQCLAYRFDWDRAGQSFRRAYELAPGDGRMIGGLAAYEATQGNFQRALELGRKAVELDPLNPVTHTLHGRSALNAREYEESLEAYDRALKLSPNMTSVRAVRAGALSFMNKLEEGLEEAKMESATGYRLCMEAILYHRLGQSAKSDEALKSLLEMGEQWGIQIAIVYAVRDEFDEAFEWFERSFELRDPGIQIISTSPALDHIRDDPRWATFVKKVGLPFIPPHHRR